MDEIDQYGTVAQLVEPGTENPWVGGSIPPGSTICPASSVGIEHPPSKRSVVGSSPMRGAIKFAKRRSLTIGEETISSRRY